VAADDILVINAGQMAIKTRPTGRQSTVITMTVTSEPITYNVSEAALLKNAAEALAKSIREQTEDISAPVKESTAKARDAAARAFTAGKPWAVRQFSGGRIGATPPVAGARRQFNHSGRLAKSIVARYAEKTKEFVLNFAANRWRVEDFKSVADMQRAIDRWISLVPALREPSADFNVQRAFRQSHKEMVTKHEMGTTHKQAVTRGQLAVRILQAAAQALGA
jgi:hypothetical protein